MNLSGSRYWDYEANQKKRLQFATPITFELDPERPLRLFQGCSEFQIMLQSGDAVAAKDLGEEPDEFPHHTQTFTQTLGGLDEGPDEMEYSQSLHDGYQDMAGTMDESSL